VTQFEGEVEPVPSHQGLFQAKYASSGEMDTIVFIDERMNPEFTPRILLSDD